MKRPNGLAEKRLGLGHSEFWMLDSEFLLS
jgi:hypothetical protein